MWYVKCRNTLATFTSLYNALQYQKKLAAKTSCKYYISVYGSSAENKSITVVSNFLGDLA